jgi:hypothetical protein
LATEGKLQVRFFADGPDISHDRELEAKRNCMIPNPRFLKTARRWANPTPPKDSEIAMTDETTSTEQLCRILRTSSQYVLSWLISQESVKEESITDWLLYDVSSKTNRVGYHLFSRQEEARHTGADWEWWFVSNRCSVGFRVQAKKIRTDKDNYPGLAYANAHGLQGEKLIQDAKRKGLGALYAFYAKNVSQVRCPKRIVDEGVFIASADEIYLDFVKPTRSKVEQDSLTSASVPLSCLFCCPITMGSRPIADRHRGSSDAAGRILGFFEEYFYSRNHRSDDRSREVEFTIPKPWDRPPEYVASLLNPNITRSSWETDFRRELEGASALLVFDLRDGNSD